MLASFVARTSAVSVLLALVIVSAGCGQPVRQDRTIEFSRDGKQVAFHHDSDGVFVAAPGGGIPTKIFQPNEDVIATSRPLSYPTDGRLLFATASLLAEPNRPQQPQTQAAARALIQAEGQVVFEAPVRFTCWLRSDPVGDQPADVKELFQAACGHVGYVSAGLAVRWHPDGKRVTYIAKVADDSRQHSVFEYDIESQKTWRVFPNEGNAVLCDWTPDGSALVCLVGNAASDRRSNSVTEHVTAGIWIGKPGEGGSWWHVPESERLPEGELPSLIEQLRSSRPAWTRDSSSFAFVTLEPSDAAVTDDSTKRLIKHRLHRVELTSRAISTTLDVEGSITDLHWSDDGQRFGCLTRSTSTRTSLKIVEPSGMISAVVSDHPIRKFAGFDSTSRRLAYVTASPINPPPSDPWWALLLRPDPLARDSVWIADIKASGQATEIFSGMRVTFPQWSPTEERLSLWLTFSPRYRSLLSSLFRWGLWPGDPAATIDVRSGDISWMAVTPQEELQIGHFHLLKGNNAEACHWYAKARGQLPAPQPPQNWTEFTQRVSAPENSQVFEFLCLKRLDREDEAQAKWQEFELNFFPKLSPESQTPMANTSENFFEAMGPQTEFLKYLIHDLYVAEVFLSVDAIDDALKHFRADALPSADDPEKLSRAIVLAQLFLIANDREAFLSHSTNTVVPLAIKVGKNLTKQHPGTTSEVLQFAAGLCLAPLFRSEFFNGLSDAVLHTNVLKWNALREQLEDGLPAVAIDLVRRAIAQNQSNPKAAKAAEEQINGNPTGRELFADKPIDDVVARWFETSRLGLAR
ncbi:MAG: hypothetical protein NT013_28735 [Planctomycetia bacterium]|nr:hypothetical protein [Planctomycetia bacterium]